jgi:hypothetical protein
MGGKGYAKKLVPFLTGSPIILVNYVTVVHRNRVGICQNAVEKSSAVKLLVSV